MFILNGKPLSPDRAFTDINDIQRPANWLRLATPEEREAAGVSEVPDPPTWDQRFSWGYTEDGQLIWKDHQQLVDQYIAQVKQTAGSLLQNTDWLVIRSQDLSSQKPIPDWALDERGVIRVKSAEKEAAIRATTTSEELAAYVTSSGFNTWSDDSVEDATDEPVIFTDNVSTDEPVIFTDNMSTDAMIG